MNYSTCKLPILNVNELSVQSLSRENNFSYSCTAFCIGNAVNVCFYRIGGLISNVDFFLFSR